MSKNNILYLDTSEVTAQIAVFKGEEKVVEESWEAGRELSKTLSQKYGNILKKAGIKGKDLTGLCVFVGPGSFTGLRIGISFVNGLAFSESIPVFETKEKEKLDLREAKKIALPFYGAEPRITKPKKR